MAKLHDERRREIIATARSLFFSEGYDAVPIARIISEVGIAKGTFYHYFTSKDELLEALIEQLSETVMERAESIAATPGLTAVQRLCAYFRESVAAKAESKELLVTAIEMLYRPENTLLRIRMVQRSNTRVAPVLARIIADGLAAGEFSVNDPELCGDYMIRSLAALSERVGFMILEDPDAPHLLGELNRMYDFMEWAVERLLGLDPGSITLADRGIADRLFGELAKELHR